MKKKNSGVIKQILKDHFDGYWTMHGHNYPESYRDDIKETVLKAIRCGTTDLGFAKYECLGCVVQSKLKFVFSHVRVDTVISVGRSTQTTGQRNNRK